MKNLPWDGLQAFALVARLGGLTGAAKALDVSPATVGRRMLKLETQVGRHLFVRSQTGYTLTDDGAALFAHVRAMEAQTHPIGAWLGEEGSQPLVRLSAGSWTARFFTTNFSRLWSRRDPFRIALKTTEARLDIAHREVEIGVRNLRPDTPGLAARRAAEVAFAPFRARGGRQGADDDWVAIGSDEAVTRSSRWVNRQPGLNIVAWANSPRTLCDLIRAGVGKSVLPCFAGDIDPLLERAGDTIDELQETQWIVMHNDDRHRAEVRTVIDRVAALVEEHTALFAGQRPIGGAVAR